MLHYWTCDSEDMSRSFQRHSACCPPACSFKRPANTLFLQTMWCMGLTSKTDAVSTGALRVRAWGLGTHTHSRALMWESQWNLAGALITRSTSGSNYTWSRLYLRWSSYKRRAILYFCLSHIRTDFLLQAMWRIFIVRGVEIWATNPPTPFCLKEKS